MEPTISLSGAGMSTSGRRPSIDFDLKISSSDDSSDEDSPSTTHRSKLIFGNISSEANTPNGPKGKPDYPPASTASNAPLFISCEHEALQQLKIENEMMEPEFQATPAASDTSVEIPCRKRRRISSGNRGGRSRPPSMSMAEFSGEPIAGTSADVTPRKHVCQSPRNEMGESSRSNEAGTYAEGTFVVVKGKREIGLITGRNSRTSEYHVRWLIRSVDTILGTIGNRQELFMTDECDDLEPSELKDTVEVHRVPQRARYDAESVEDLSELRRHLEKSRNVFFYQKRYIRIFVRFEDIPVDDDHQAKNTTCYNCETEQKNVIEPIGKPKFDTNTRQYVVKEVQYRDQKIRWGSDVFLTPGSLHQLPQHVAQRADEGEYDQILYPEKYRKRFDAEEEQIMPQPFDVGRVCDMFSETSNFDKEYTYIRVRKYYRPHNTCITTAQANQEDLNLLYWSDEETTICFTEVQGKCFVANGNDPDVIGWSNKGPYRFFVKKKFSKSRGTFTPLSESDEQNITSGDGCPPDDWPTLERPLATMDIFSGAGGLSTGLRQSGVAKVKWAVECNESAAATFRLNFPRATVYESKCEDQLRAFMQGDGPRSRREVQLLCCGLPNIDRLVGYSSNDSPITTFCSYVEYFRPRHVILETGKRFLHVENGKVLQKTLKRLIEAGYQVTIGLLQCGKYGVPQCRRRVVILAAAPGENLPKFPEPLMAFTNNLLTARVLDQDIATDLQWSSGPYRAMTVADALSDLPPMVRGEEDEENKFYGTRPITHFQKMVRGERSRAEDVLTYHVCKIPSMLDYERIRCIPPAGDWRDLPNIEMNLPNGRLINKLKYTHDDWKNGQSADGEYRGVCSCAEQKGAACKKEFKQPDAIIPWCLSHTANRQGQWSGLFGRVPLEGYFHTIGANMDVMGRTGWTVHPTENRILSVRECARAQGFPDSFRFAGTIKEKYEQVGNACPPLLTLAIGRSMISAQRR